jgi:hypothetical protein
MEKAADDIARAKGQDTAESEREDAKQAQPRFGSFKSTQKWENQMKSRGWTEEEITRTMLSGARLPTYNNVNPGNGATRIISPNTGQSLVIDNLTGEVLHVGGPRFDY